MDAFELLYEVSVHRLSPTQARKKARELGIERSFLEVCRVWESPLHDANIADAKRRSFDAKLPLFVR